MPNNAPPGKKRGKRRFAPPLPAPKLSSRLYVRLAPRDVALFRFLLEAEDNLAYITTVDRWRSVVCVTFSPHQERAVLEYLDSMRERIAFTVIFRP